MRTRQLTIYNDSPTFNMLSECDQIAYRQNGTIHPADEERTQGNGKYRGCGASFVRRHEIRMLQDLFLADYFAPIDSHVSAPMFLIKSHDYGIIKVEVFFENYLMECQELFYESVVLRLLYCRQQVEIVGDKCLISVTRKIKS